MELSINDFKKCKILNLVKIIKNVKKTKIIINRDIYDLECMSFICKIPDKILISKKLIVSKKSTFILLLFL